MFIIDVQICVATESGDCARQRTPVRILEARAAECRSMPRDVGDGTFVDLASIKVRPRQRRMRLPERDQALHEAQHVVVRVDHRPIEPVRRIVLVVRIVVA